MRVRTHSNPLNFYQRLEKPDFSLLFSNPVSDGLDVEIGSAGGLFLRHYAQAFLDRNIIGVEVRKKLVEVVQERLRRDQLSNVMMVYGSAERVFEDMLDDGTVNRVFVFHPDPWFKKRHHNRRVIRPDFLEIIAQKMKPGGLLYVSTDVAELWDAMTESIGLNPQFEPAEDPEFWSNYYLTNWKLFSESDRRTSHFGVFCRR